MHGLPWRSAVLSLEEKQQAEGNSVARPALSRPFVVGTTTERPDPHLGLKAGLRWQGAERVRVQPAAAREVGIAASYSGLRCAQCPCSENIVWGCDMPL